MGEKSLLNEIMLLYSRHGHRMFRNNIAVAWAGKVLRNHINHNTITIINPRPIHAGLCVGSSDLIGWVSVTVTPEMVGKKVAIFTANEVKMPGVATTKEQRNFIDAVNEAGGIGKIVKRIEEAEEGFSCFRK